MKKILVVEDEHAIREGIRLVLSLDGYDIIEADNGQTALEKIKQCLPDLILCDIMMPIMSGYELLQALRQNQDTIAIPFIFLTARTDKPSMREGMNLGADDYIMKPFTGEDLLEAVRIRFERESVHTQKLEELRENISTAIPHELRTPLSSIMGFAQMLSEFGDTLSDEEVCEIGRTIYRGSVGLHRLIENYILYSELSTKTKDELIETYVDEPYAETSEIIINVAQEKGKEKERKNDILLKTCIEEMAFASDNSIRKIMEELIDNALKFSEPNTPIQITSYVTDDHYHIEVIDQGCGMTPQQIEKIGAYMQFNRNYREQQGSGLGLVITKFLTELENGTLTIESEPEKQTTVKLRFNRYFPPESCS